MTFSASRPLVALPLVLLSLLSGCMRPTGDFGRAEPSVLNDTLMPAFGAATAKYVRQEQVSGFNGTDEEARLRDHAWALVMPPHTGDWLGEHAVEWQRTRILREMDSAFDPRAYYAFLRRETFASSEARWSRLIADMRTDRELVEPFWSQAARVKADDRLRMQSLDARGRNADAGELANAYARIDENARVVDWVWRSLRYRVKAYRNAIERMAVETPSRQATAASIALHDLELKIAAAETGNGATVQPSSGFRPSRLTDARLINQAVPQK